MKFKEKYSTEILKGRVNKNINKLYSVIISFLFRKVKLDPESIELLNEYSKKGKILFVSFQNSNIFLSILLNLLNKNKMQNPGLALDFTLNSISGKFYNIKKLLKKILNNKNSINVNDFEYIKRVFEEDKSIIISLLSKSGFKSRYFEKGSDHLENIIKIQNGIDESIFIFPTVMFWSKDPERTRSIFAAKPTSNKGFISGILSIMRSATPGFVRVTAPIDLKKEIESSAVDDSKQISKKLRNNLLEIYNHDKRLVLGPVIKSSQEMMEKVLYHKNVENSIASLVKKDVTEKHLKKRSYQYFKEIAADYSIFYIRLGRTVLDWLFGKIFDDVVFDPEDFKEIRKAAKKGPLILVPSHKSHMDYLLITRIFYENNLVPPHIIAGSNLNFFPVGKLFRKTGAFFMRRSFNGIPLYASVFKQYVKTLISEGYPVEFFLEGGRTRTGKMLSPKVGILKYLIESIEEGYNKDMVFLPITLNYDRVLEETSYKAEIGGKIKDKESSSVLFQSRKLLKKNYGKIYFSVEKPILYSDLKKKFNESTNLPFEIGNYLSDKINNSIKVTNVSLVTTAMLQFSKNGFDFNMLKERVIEIFEFLTFVNVKMTAIKSKDDLDDVILKVLKDYEKDGIVNKPKITDDEDGADLFVMNANERTGVSFYKNTIIHYLLPASFFSMALLLKVKDGIFNKKEIKREFENIKNLFSNEFQFSSKIKEKNIVDKILNYFDLEDKEKVFDSKKFNHFSSSIKDYVESYLIVLKSTVKLGRKSSYKDFLANIKKNGARMFHLGNVELAESLSMLNYKSAVSTLLKMGIITEKKINKRNSEITLVDIKKARLLLVQFENYLSVI